MTYDDLINDVVLDCPGVPVPVAIRAIREAVRQFCKESGAYRKKLNSATDLSYANGVYTIAIPANSIIESVISPMVFDGSYTIDMTTYSLQQIPVQGANPEWMDINYPGWRTDNRKDAVEHFVMLSTNTFVLTPDTGTDRKANLTVSLILSPDRITTTLDDEFGNRWFDFLVAGAKFLLMVMPDKKWSNPQLGAYYQSKFVDGIADAKNYIKSAYRRPRADGIQHVRGYYK